MERRAAALVFFFAFAVCALLTKPHALSWNDLSRLATVDSLVSRGTFAIDGSTFAAQTYDKYRYGGRTYSDKPPALALQGAAVAEIVRPLGITLERTPHTAIYLITLFTVGFWFALGSAYAYAFQRLLGFTRVWAALAAGLTGMATLALPYATVLANHVPAGAAALAGVYHLVRGRTSVVNAAIGGLFLTLAYAFDASQVVFAIAAIALLWGAPARTWIVFGLACIPVVAAQLAFNGSVSSGLGPPAINQATWADPSSPFHRADQTLLPFSSTGDYFRYAAYLLIGDKGLIVYTPLTLVCAYGFARMCAGSAEMRRIAVAVVSTFVLYFILMVAFTNDYGSLNYGERRYVDLFFVVFVALGPARAALADSANAVARIAMQLSIALAMLGVLAPFGEPRHESGIAFVLREFNRLAQHAPAQALIDAAAALLIIYAASRFWSSAPVPKYDSDPAAALPS